MVDVGRPVRTRGLMLLASVVDSHVESEVVRSTKAKVGNRGREGPCYSRPWRFGRGPISDRHGVGGDGLLQASVRLPIVLFSASMASVVAEICTVQLRRPSRLVSGVSSESA